MKKTFIAAILLLSPGVAFADVNNLTDLVKLLQDFANSLIPLILAIAVIGLLWGIIRYIWSADVKKLQDARKFIVFSILGITVMLSIWAIALTLKNMFFPDAAIPYSNTSGSGTYQGQGIGPCPDPYKLAPGC